MFNWIKNKANNGSSNYQDQNVNIRIVGPRGSGKTGYMAALAYWPNAKSDSPVESVTPIGEETSKLIENAQNILEQGLDLEPTRLDSKVEEVKDYTITITVKNKYQWQNGVKINVNCKDYSGEFFRDLINKKGDPLLEDYLDDCLQASGIMFLLDGTSYRSDREYAAGLEKFLLALDQTDLENNKRRIALVLTKCEQSELWINRDSPAKLTQLRFPQVYQKLQNWANLKTGEVEYFVTSAFGVLGTNFPEPNSQKIERNREGTKSIIKNPRRWRPFALVAPIYWLSTGQRNKDLEQ